MYKAKLTNKGWIVLTPAGVDSGMWCGSMHTAQALVKSLNKGV